MKQPVFFKRPTQNCATCPLRDRTKVFAVGKADSKIAIYGEAPGNRESKEGQPFVGMAGRFLNWGLMQAGLVRNKLVLSNTILCRPPQNDIGSFEAQEAQGLCRAGFFKEIDYLKEKGIKVIIALGATAKKYFGIEGSITNVRGSVYKFEGLYVIPTWHPSYLMRNQWKKDRATVSMKYIWIADLKKAKSLAEGKISIPEEEFLIEPTIEQIESLLSYKGNLLALDVETTGLDYHYAKIVVLGIGLSESKAVSIPFLRQRTGEHYWSPSRFSIILNILNELFNHSPLMLQNAAFDLNFLRSEGIGIPWENVAHDTMILHSYISPELPHNLGFITSIYGMTPYWKDTLRDRKGSILDMNPKALYTYNLRDVVTLHQILPPMVKEAEELGVYKIYKKEGMRMLKPVMQMEQKGVLLSNYRLLKWKQELEKEEKELDEQLRDLGHLPKSFNFNSDDDLRYFLFGIVPSKFKKLANFDKKKPGTRVYDDLKALKAIRDTVRPILDLRNYSGTRTRKSKKLAVNKEGLLSLQIFLNNRLAVINKLKNPKLDEIDKIEKLQRFLGFLKRHRELNKLINTFTNFPTDGENRVHSHYSIIGTVTKRLTSSNPNLQQIPKKAIDARKVFIAPKGFVLLSADYSNLEVRVLAYVTNDEVLISAFERGENIHDVNTKMAFNIDEDDPMWKLARRAAKIFFFGGISYGGGDRTIHQKVVLEVPELNLTFNAYKQMKANWIARHPAYTKWKGRTTKQVLRSRILKDSFNRVRVFFGDNKDIIKEGLNFPIQGTAAGVINKAMIKIDDTITEQTLTSSLIMQIHDQLVYEVPKDELEEMKKIVKETMEEPVNINGKMISFPVDLEIGPSLGELV